MSSSRKERLHTRQGSTAEVGAVTGSVRGNPTRIDPVMTHVPWMKSKGRLRSRDDQCSGDRTARSRRRVWQNKPEQPIPRCLGCGRQVQIVTDEDLQMPLCSHCVIRDDEFFVRIAMKLVAFQEAEADLYAEGLQSLADQQFGPLE